MDLELPEDFTPVNADGETESFQLVSVAQVCGGYQNRGSLEYILFYFM